MRGNNKIGVGSMATSKVGEMEQKAKLGRSRRLRKEVAGCVKAIAGKKRFSDLIPGRER